MGKTIVILGTLDTKGELLHHLKRQIERRGHKALILDISMGSTPSFAADIPTAEIASTAGRRIEDLISTQDRPVSTKVMIDRAICGMVEEGERFLITRTTIPLCCHHPDRFNEGCAVEVKRLLEQKGYHVYLFHANGISDRSMEQLIAQGFFDGTYRYRTSRAHRGAFSRE